MKPVSIEKFIERIDCDVFPVTIMKFLLNRKKILNCFSKIVSSKFKGMNSYKLSPETCKVCERKKSLDMLCRQHTSIDRVISADNVAFDVDTNIYFYKNEIFREIDGKLVIFYCPHTKLLSGDRTNSKVRRIDLIIVEDPEFKGLPEYRKIFKFVSTELMEKNMKCWFNYEFSIITLPEDMSYCNWCLVPNL